MSSPSPRAVPAAPAYTSAAVLRGSLAVLASALLFGLSGAAARAIFQSHALPPLVMVQVRVTLAFLVMLAGVSLWRPAELAVPRGLRPRVLLWGAGPLLLVQYTYFLAIRETNVATASFLEYTAPVLGALYARVIGREALSSRVLAGLALAMAGSGLLILGGGAGLALSPIGLAAGVAAAVMMTWYTVLANQLTQRMSPWALLTWGLGGAALVGFLFTPPWRVLPHLQAPELWAFFIYLGVLAAAVPFSLYIYGLRSLRPTPALILMTAEPVVGAVAAWVFLAEALRPLQVLGAAGIMAAVLLVQLSAARR